MPSTLLKLLPSVDRLLCHHTTASVLAEYPHDLVVEQLRETLKVVRAELRDASSQSIPADEALIALARERLVKIAAPGLQRVVNATGVVLHTNLGRAVLARQAIDAVRLAASE